MSHRVRPPRRHLRAVATLLLAAWSWAFIGAVFHGETDQHRYCAEHQTFEETGAGDAVTTRPVGPSSRVSETAAPADLHEACAFVEQAVRGEPEVLPTVAQAPPVVPPRPPLVHVEHVTPPIPLLHTAPKASPPATV